MTDRLRPKTASRHSGMLHDRFFEAALREVAPQNADSMLHTPFLKTKATTANLGPPVSGMRVETIVTEIR